MKAVAKTGMLRIARIIKSNGIEGEVQAELFIPSDEIEKEEPVYIVFDGLPVPFFIENLSPKGNRKAYLRLTDVENLEDADELEGKEIYILDDGGRDETSLFSIEGWTVYDTEGNEIGEITGSLDIPENPCIIVEHNGKEIYIPFHEDLISGYDKETGKISMDIPKGLL